jgi:hypothetical protein
MRGIKTFGVLVVAAAFWVLPETASAVSVCGGNTNVIDYNSQGGCTSDGLLFSNFAVTPAAPGSPDDVIAVASWVIGSTAYFGVNPLLGLGAGIEDIWFSFTVSTLSGAASIFGVDLENLGAGGTFITEAVCTTAFVGNSCAAGGGTIIANLSASDGQTDFEFFAPRSTINVFKDIGVSSSGHISSFTQSFHVPDGGSTAGLLGMALLGIRFARSRIGRR